MGRGGAQRRRDGREVGARPADRRGRPRGRDHRERRGEELPRPARHLVQVRGRRLTPMSDRGGLMNGPRRSWLSLRVMSLLTGTPTLSLTLPPRPESASRVRRALVQHGLEDELEHTVTLLHTEIVPNSVRLAAGTSEVHIAAML